MTAKEKLSELLTESYDLEFEIVEIIKEGQPIAKIKKTI